VKQDIEGALQDYDQAIQLDPHNGNAYASRSQVRLVKYDLDGALVDAEKALKLDPAIEAGYWSRAYILYDRRAWPDAMAAFRTLAEKATAQEEWLPLRMWIIRVRMGDIELASKELSNARKQMSEQSEPLALQIASLLLGELTEEQLLQAAGNNGKRDTQFNLCDAHFYCGIVRLIREDGRGAKAHFQKCIETNCMQLYDWSSAQAELRHLVT